MTLEAFVVPYMHTKHTKKSRQQMIFYLFKACYGFSLCCRFQTLTLSVHTLIMLSCTTVRNCCSPSSVKSFPFSTARQYADGTCGVCSYLHTYVEVVFLKAPATAMSFRDVLPRWLT